MVHQRSVTPANKIKPGSTRAIVKTVRPASFSTTDYGIKFVHVGCTRYGEGNWKQLEIKREKKKEQEEIKNNIG